MQKIRYQKQTRCGARLSHESEQAGVEPLSPFTACQFVHVRDVGEYRPYHQHRTAGPKPYTCAEQQNDPPFGSRFEQETREHGGNPYDPGYRIRRCLAPSLPNGEIDRYRANLNRHERAKNEIAVFLHPEVVGHEIDHYRKDNIHGNKGKQVHHKDVSERTIVHRLCEGAGYGKCPFHLPKALPFAGGEEDGQEGQRKQKAEDDSHNNIATALSPDGYRHGKNTAGHCRNSRKNHADGHEGRTFVIIKSELGGQRIVGDEYQRMVPISGSLTASHVLLIRITIPASEGLMRNTSVRKKR